VEPALGSQPLAIVLPSKEPTKATSPAKSASTTVMASFYDTGRITANGESFAPMGLTAAHRSLPFGTKLRVTNKRTGQSIVVRVNDRGPYIAGRSLDLSRGAARAIGMENAGVIPITMEVVTR
jgi:rare lipoprotein A